VKIATDQYHLLVEVDGAPALIKLDLANSKFETIPITISSGSAFKVNKILQSGSLFYYAGKASSVTDGTNS